MGWRFRRTIKILPGVRLNFSRSGVSTTFGPRGAKLAIGPRGIRRTAGIPGTGLSYTENEPLHLHHEAEQSSGNTGGVSVIVACIVLLVVIGILIRVFA